MTHKFGGDWTDLKLDVMKAYFAAYSVALKNQPFECWYIDAFAGTGERTDSRDQGLASGASLFGDEASAVAEAKAGSVQLALEIDPPFSRYILIDRSREHVSQLERFRTFRPDQVEPVYGDANEVLTRIAATADWKGRRSARATRAAVFVDPYGMQVNWSTLEKLAATRAVDIALLFPTGPLNRLLKRDGNIPPEWARRIDEHLGPCDWRSALYRESRKQDLFGDMLSTEKAVVLTQLQDFIRERLASLFHYVHPESVPLKNSKGSVLYDLFIMCANPSPKAVELVQRLANGAIRASRKPRS